MITVVLIVVHLSVAASWWGSMLYSLTVVQPKITLFFTDEQRREEFLLALAHGNRWRVLALATVLILTGLSVTMVGPRHVVVGYAGAVVLYAAATLIFAYVSWWHWPGSGLRAACAAGWVSSASAAPGDDDDGPGRYRIRAGTHG